MRRLLLAVLLAAPTAASAAPIDCAKNPRRAMPVLVKRAMKNGHLKVLNGIPASLVGWGAPAKEFLFGGKNGSANLVEVVVAQGKSADDLHPVSVVLVRSIPSPEKDVRTFVTTSLSGKLDAALGALDVHKDGPSTGTQKTVLTGEEARRAHAELLDWACHVVTQNVLSYQEQLAAQAKKIGAPDPN